MRIASLAAVAVTFATATLGFSAPQAHAGTLLEFRVKNMTTGKCLQWNGYDKPVSQVTCKKTMKQYWGKAGTMVQSMGTGLIGEGCLTAPKKHEGRAYGRVCSDQQRKYIGWAILSTAPNAKGVIGSASGGYLKVVKSGQVVVGKRVSGNRDLWKFIA
ncbi:hypothetical protein [Streptomyces sp. Ncost-T10-10d]|uniref:hypothetical protein n=1 Tax=Streptomyces sp. Ncost-T10-10d TaxID=1839774 RepID=UPI00081EE29B|nr:hypothetical protein [Streptomyces sp. Ncost-T10-10d]SCF75332.1 hypothetical protein GA0115254_1156130 [Streptomyces sp. Ncost-T10-10d]